MIAFIDKHKKYFFGFFLILSLWTLLYITRHLSISYEEADIYFSRHSFVHYLACIFTYIFGHNNYALRIPFIVFYYASIFVFFKLCENFFSKNRDRYYASILFMFLPGVFTSALLLNSAIIIVFFTLLFLYLYKKTDKYNYFLLILFVFIDNSFVILFLSLAIFSLMKKDKINFFIALALCLASIWLYGFFIGHRPRSYFFDTFGVYASIFSPLLFVYFIYVLYRIGTKGEKTLFWLIPTTSLLLSLLLSFRQKIAIEDFAPFLVLGIPFVVRMFLKSYRIRLKQFRNFHNTILIITLLLLIMSLGIAVFNRGLYLVLDRPEMNFAYKYNFADELAKKLKKDKILKVTCLDERLQKRLLFYGIKKGGMYYLSTFQSMKYFKKIPIKVKHKVILSYYLKKDEK